MTKSITIDSSYFKRVNPPQDPQQGDSGNESGASGSGQGNNLKDLTLSNNERKDMSAQTLESILDYIYQDEYNRSNTSDIIGSEFLRSNLESVSEQIKRRKRYF
jgi:hypothetical protein